MFFRSPVNDILEELFLLLATLIEVWKFSAWFIVVEVNSLDRTNRDCAWSFVVIYVIHNWHSFIFQPRRLVLLLERFLSCKSWGRLFIFDPNHRKTLLFLIFKNWLEFSIFAHHILESWKPIELWVKLLVLLKRHAVASCELSSIFLHSYSPLLTCFLFSSVGHLLLKCHALSRNHFA